MDGFPGIYPRRTERSLTYFVQASVGGEHRYLGTFATLQQARARLLEMHTRLPPIRRPPRFGHVEKRKNNRWAASVQIKGLRFFVGGYATRSQAEKALKKVHDLGDADRMIASLQARRASRPTRRERGSISYRHDRRENNWRARLSIAGTRIHVGHYQTAKDAEAALSLAVSQYSVR
jgi:hypothetical protein